MISIDPKTTAVRDLHQYLVGAIAPRPIAFVSTLNEKGEQNLAPYSFFNVFSSNPPTLVFSSNRRVSDNTTKDTLQNIKDTGELVINVVSYSIVRQMAITSIQYPSSVDEFQKSGLTPIDSLRVSPCRVKESPVQLECKLKEIITLGDHGGAGHLIICEVVHIHLDENILDDNGRINPHKIDLVGRMGRAYYVRASGEAIHTIYQAVNELGIGYDQLPSSAKDSRILTGNNLGQLASLTSPPSAAEVEELRADPYIQTLLRKPEVINTLHEYAQRELIKEQLPLAAKIVWLAELITQEAKVGS